MPRKGDKEAAQRRRFPVGVDPRAQARRERAQVRQAEYDALTLEEKIERTNYTPGLSARELERLRRNQ